jgi:peptide/nickel transport system substrate-binding protein
MERFKRKMNKNATICIMMSLMLVAPMVLAPAMVAQPSISASAPVLAQSVHVVPTSVYVKIEQLPYTVFVAIVATFDETGVKMDLGNVILSDNGDYTVEVNCIRVSGPTPGNFNFSVVTTLGIPDSGSHTVYVKEPALNRVLAYEPFTMMPSDILFSEDGIVAGLKTYLNYTKVESKTVPPSLYRYTRFWVNSTSSLAESALTLGIRLNNTLAETLSDVKLALSAPSNISFNVTPSVWTYGTLSPSASSVGFFNITAQDVPIGCYNFTYALNYTKAGGPYYIAGVIPVGVYLANSTWMAGNQTGIVDVISPFNDTGTFVFYNYTTIDTIDGYTLQLWQNTNRSLAFSEFTGTPHSPFWWVIIAAAVGAVTSAVVEGVRQYANGEEFSLGKIGTAAAIGAAVGVGAALGLGALATAAGVVTTTAIHVEEIVIVEAIKTIVEIEKALVEEVIEDFTAGLEGKVSQGEPTSSETEGSCHVDPAPEDKLGSNVVPARAISRSMDFVEATIEGAGVQHVDPPACYDTASAELLMQVYDTLVMYDGEHMNRYLPSLATEWSIVQNIPPILDADTGLTFKWTYYFKIRTGVQFHNLALATLVPSDVEYAIERGMVMEAGDNPQWMFYEPLLNGAAASFIDGVEYDPDNIPADAVFVGKCIDHAVVSNSTHVWFNLVFDGSYAPFMQILCQYWASIYSKPWANSLGRTNWDGTWGDYTGWVAYHYPATPPLDDPTPALMGTGPFVFGNLDPTLMYWDVNRFTNYWRGWGSGPAPNYGIGWPAFGGSKPAGYIDHYKVTWAYDWTARSALFLAGDVDYCSVPTQYKNDIIGQPNIRSTFPLPSLSVGVAHYQFDIRTTSPYGPIYEYGIIGEAGVPRDFFGNTTYGIYNRKAFSYCIDFPTYLSTVFLGEALQPPTAMIPTLPYYNASITKYSLNLTKAAELFHMWPGLWETGFTLRLPYNIGNLARQNLCEMLATNVNSLNPTKFHASALGLDWPSFLAASNGKQLPVFVVGWLADYPDAHNFAYPYYYSYGTFAARQGYSDPVMDALVEAGIRTPDGLGRAQIYSAIQQRAIDICPSIALYSATGRHWEQTWVVGWYYNPIYPGIYAANLWKWYYTPHAQLVTVTPATSNLLPYDVNYDGKTNMIDIGTTAASFMCIYGPPMSTKWLYRCDLNNDRKIDMKDIASVAKNFGKTSTAWTPPP